MTLAECDALCVRALLHSGMSRNSAHMISEVLHRNSTSHAADFALGRAAGHHFG